MTVQPHFLQWRKLIYRYYWNVFQLLCIVWGPRRLGGALAFWEGPCRIRPVCSQLAIALSSCVPWRQAALRLPGPGRAQAPCSCHRRYTPRGLICLSLSHLIPSFPVEQMQREKAQWMIIKYYLTPPQVEGKLISSISPCLWDVDKIGWGGVCESTFTTTVRCWTVEELQLWGRCHEGQILSHWGFPPIPNTWLFSWVEHGELVRFICT